ncbi:pepsin-like aspartic protease [Aspergillus affinis]|uniref:pepsin-like aspartic protease n=1 Tax=Aspergillus affinis TaxID=1070780 RepID=UPI0022FE8831|nr:aspartic endopeptidase Pep1/aspergillopepsin F [Aspergillus affinis]KAI9043422.1 aspartic endopeptidase Pep1/aspergillopepsin F [Aspergillus affinis]
MVIFSKVTTAALGLASVASALPHAQPRKGFTVNQITRQSANPKTLNLPAQYAKFLAKYGATVPQSVKDAASKGTAVTKPEEYDSEYLTPVTIGGTTLNLDFDTGSADLWVFSSELSSSEQSGHSVYKPSDNATKLQGSTWDISYGDGSSASGDVYKDTVTVGGVTAKSQAVEAASTISSEFTQDKNNDGLLGLAFSSINTVEPKAQTTFFDTVKSQLDSPLFAVALKYHAAGSYDFGFLDDSKYTGEITYSDVDTSQGFWQFTADGYAVGDGATKNDPITAIADTGTTLILIDDSIVSAYYKQVTGAKNDASAGGYVFPCSTDLPTFTVVIGDYKAVVPGKHINYAPVTEGGSSCFGGIQSNSGLGLSILGDVFLKSQYAVFDSEGPRIGFAKQA